MELKKGIFDVISSADPSLLREWLNSWVSSLIFISTSQVQVCCTHVSSKHQHRKPCFCSLSCLGSNIWWFQGLAHCSACQQTVPCSSMHGQNLECLRSNQKLAAEHDPQFHAPVCSILREWKRKIRWEIQGSHQFYEHYIHWWRQNDYFFRMFSVQAHSPL